MCLKKRSQTQHALIALLNLISMISKQKQEGYETVYIFLDGQKAFDVADHSIRIDKLQYCGIRVKYKN